MVNVTNRRWCLAHRPEGHLNAKHFDWQEVTTGELEERQVLVRTLYLSLDPTNRIWASDMDQYMPPVEIGEVMRGANLGVVEESNDERFPIGGIVSGMWGWQSHHLGDPTDLTLIDVVPGVPLTAYMSILGINGMTAYFGLFDVAEVKRSDTVVVSAAAGSVGSMAAQMAKIEGCRVVGIAGGPDKCQWLTEKLKLDAAVDYRGVSWETDLKRACPHGVDLYFDNVGGVVTDAVIDVMNNFGRLAVCGMISQYNQPEPWPGPSNYGQVLMRRLMIRGFLVSDYFSRFVEGMRVVATWLAEGRIRYDVDIVEGLENAPAALDRLFTGTNTGKLLVRCSPEP